MYIYSTPWLPLVPNVQIQISLHINHPINNSEAILAEIYLKEKQLLTH